MISKELGWAEPEYMNMHPSPSIKTLGTLSRFFSYIGRRFILLLCMQFVYFHCLFWFVFCRLTCIFRRLVLSCLTKCFSWGGGGLYFVDSIILGFLGTVIGVYYMLIVYVGLAFGSKNLQFHIICW